MLKTILGRGGQAEDFRRAREAIGAVVPRDGRHLAALFSAAGRGRGGLRPGLAEPENTLALWEPALRARSAAETTASRCSSGP
jgi:hypothetical protein